MRHRWRVHWQRRRLWRPWSRRSWRCHGNGRAGGLGPSRFWSWATGRDSSSRQIHLQELAVRGQRELPIFGLQAVDMNRSIRRLRGHKFIERIPSNTLNVMRMLSNLPHHLPCNRQQTSRADSRVLRCLTRLRVINPRDVIHASRDDKHAIRRPGQVVDFSSRRATHVLYTPGLLVVRSILSQPGLCL